MKKKQIKTLKELLALMIVGATIYFFPNIFPKESSTNAERQEVELAKCIDGDTARFIADGEEKKYRFLLIDTPESTNKIEPYGKEASEFVCKKLKEADKIEISYQEHNDTTDKYGRELVWVFVDDQLLQTEIARAGYVKQFYDNNRSFDYKDEIIQACNEAKENHVGMYE